MARVSDKCRYNLTPAQIGQVLDKDDALHLDNLNELSIFSDKNSVLSYGQCGKRKTKVFQFLFAWDLYSQASFARAFKFFCLIMNVPAWVCNKIHINIINIMLVLFEVCTGESAQPLYLCTGESAQPLCRLEMSPCAKLISYTFFANEIKVSKFFIFTIFTQKSKHIIINKEEHLN